VRITLGKILWAIVTMGVMSWSNIANAQDWPGSRNSSSTPYSGQNWNGFYVGAHLGYGMGNANSADISGFTLGGQIGLNMHVGPLVLGAEADLTYSGIDYRGFSDAFQQKWLMSGRGRVGYAFDRFMPYVTAGVAHTSTTLKAPSGKSEQGHFGYVVGIGSEAMLTSNVSARIEFLHYRFGSETYTLPAIARSTGVTTNTIRFGINYRF
jgi:outer membrane immunogenic protein